MSKSKPTIQSDFLEHRLRDTAADRQDKEVRASSSEPLPLTSTAAKDQCLLGDWYFKARQFALAILAYKRALELDPECAAIYHRLGLAHYKEGEFDSAKDAFRKAISLNPSNANYHYALGQLLQDFHDFDGAWQEAIHEFTQAIELDPSYVEAWYDRGSLYDKQGKLEKASNDFQQVIAQMPRALRQK